MLPARVPTPFVVALVATLNRPLFLRRALDSIAKQTRPPNAIIVVEDAPEISQDVRSVVADYIELVILLKNRRTKGAAGAWCSGIDEATRRFGPESAVYIAVLDDDDWWDPEHIDSCLSHALAQNADMVAAAIVRHDDADPNGRIQVPCSELSADLALVGNPHIQGSNLFVRLSTLLSAGIFDESLASTTDRDLIIRLADLRPTYSALEHATVHHDARGDRCRLSTAGSQAKADGLRSFYQKYRLRMTETQRQAFKTRASTLFNTAIQDAVASAPAKHETTQQAIARSEATDLATPLVLVVGITADGDKRGADRVAPLLSDLLALQTDKRLAALDVVLVENGPGGDSLRSLVDAMIGRGLRCYLAEPRQQHEDAAQGFFGPSFVRSSNRMGISEARAITQRYVRRLMRPGSAAWILDDDKRLKPLVHHNGALQRDHVDVIGSIIDLRDQGADIVLGVDTGAAPLPAAATLRTQLVDLCANLQAMQTLGPHEIWPDRTAENLKQATAFPDYYYDFARRHTSHLEHPFWFLCEQPNTSVMEAFVELCERAPRILAGEQVFRPLFVVKQTTLTLRPSIRRGGSTLVFAADALVDVPQMVPAADGRPSRRSDMVWALLNARFRDRRVEEAPFAVFHDRADLDDVGFDVTTLVDDIRGYALYSTLIDIEQEWPGLVDVDNNKASLRARDRYQKYLTERVAALVLSFHRARGAAQVILRLATTPEAWWAADPRTQASTTRIAALATRALTQLDPSLIKQVQNTIADTEPLVISEYMRSLRAKLEEASQRVPLKPEWLRQERVRIANAQVKRLALPPHSELSLLGVGHEGVVFTDGQSVFKYLDLFRARASYQELALLRSLVGAWSGTEALYPLHRLIEHEHHTILVYPYEPSEPYTGGNAEGLVQLLRECQKHNVVFRNMHPRNLRVVGKRVVLVDYGSDLVAMTPEEWRQMTRRTWLCFRWAHHPELDTLMKRALREEIPELTGWERLEQAVLATDAKSDLDALILAEVLSTKPSRVLDYGCGAGKTVLELAKLGIYTLGFDPESSPRWHPEGAAFFTTDREQALLNGPYDTVVCSLVLCTLQEPSYQESLQDLRAAVREGGTAIVAICHPFHTHGGSTPLQDRLMVPALSGDETFVWAKRIRSTGGERMDVHRPLHRLKRDLLRAGLVVEAIAETHTVDLARLEPASDFMVLRLRVAAARPNTSLLIRASALEWRTLCTQIHQLVRQLEGPTAFAERIVVLDSKRDQFVRQYEDADLEAARAELARLVAEGTIDRIVDVPVDPAELIALNKRWFNLDAEGGHTQRGVPVAASLVGFEACTGEFILHVDDDLLIGRLDPAHDYLREMIAALEGDPLALCVSLNIAQQEDTPFSFQSDPPFRVEVRGTLLHRERLYASRPWPNEKQEGVLAKSWYRALDERIRETGKHSLRGGRASTFFIHPQNESKRDRDAWFAILDRVENGVIPALQWGSVDLQGGLDEWLGPKRTEKLVVIACGHDVPAGRMARFRASLEMQTEREFGLIVVEDGGSSTSADIVAGMFGAWSNTTVLTLRERRGGLANIVWALRYLCTNPQSIVALVDLDDALLGAGALARVVREYEQGADLTVGGMVRTDKICSYPVHFADLRRHRGGNVWQHLRTFRRALFDRVPDEALRLDGQYVDLAWDWALMVPLVEAAVAPRFIDEPLYLYEPSGLGKTGAERAKREEIIGAIMSKARQSGGART